MISMRLLIILASLAATPAALANPSQAVAPGAPAADGPDKEVKVLLDTPFVKLVSITLRKGTVLADHAAPTAVTLMATAGSGSVKVGDEVMPIGGAQVVVLAPNAVHAVTSSGEAPLVVLVHYLKGSGAGPHAGHACAGGKCACGGGKCEGGKCTCEGGKCACEGGQCACEGGKCADGKCGDGGCACKDGACACKDGACEHKAPAQP